MSTLRSLTQECILEWFKLSQSISASIAVCDGNEDALIDLLGWLRLANLARNNTL